MSAPTPPPPPHQFPSGSETPPGPTPTESGPTPSKKPKKKTEKRLRVGVAILGFLTALLALATGILAAVAHNTSQQNQTLTVNLNDANGEKSSAAASLSAAQSTINSLQSQLATATAASPPGGPSGSVAPTGITIRRKTNDLVLVTGATYVDLDSKSDPQWRGEGVDIGWSTDAFPYNGSAWILPVGQKADYNTCYNSTKWDEPRLTLQTLEPHQYFCLKTTEKRYAAIQVLNMTASQADIAVEVYDPPDTQ